MNRRQWLTLSGATAIASSISSSAIAGLHPQSPATPPCDPEVFEISTRHLPCNVCAIPKSFSFDIHRSSLCGGWSPATLQDATYLGDPNRITILYAHGNWMERNNSRNRAQFIARQLACRTDRPFRLLMISWPSEREGLPIRDIRQNAACTDAQSFYMAYVLRQLEQESEISFLGFSLGGRVVSSSLHLIGGGKIEGRTLGDVWPGCRICEEEANAAPNQPCKTVYRVSFVAPAVEANCLQPCGRNHRAMRCVDRLVNIYNSRDPVLRRFRFLNESKPTAAGFAGFLLGDANPPLAQHDRVVQHDCNKSLGVTHDEVTYLTKCPNMSSAFTNLLWK